MKAMDPAWLPDEAALKAYFGRVARYAYYKVQLIRYVSRLLPEGPCRLLDVGAGDGSLSGVIQRFRPESEVVGVETFIRDRAWRFADAPLVRFDGKRLPFADGSFDCALVSNVLHHIGDRSAQLGMLQEIRRVTRRRIVIKDHLASGAMQRAQLAVLDVLGNRRFGASTTGTYLSEQDWGTMFAALEPWTATWHRGLRFRQGVLEALFTNGLEIMFTLHAPSLRDLSMATLRA